MASAEKLPANPAAERAVLGAIMSHDRAMWAVLDVLKPEDFYTRAHRTVYEACYDIAREGEGVDLVTVAGWLEANGKMEEVGGFAALSAVVDELSNPGHVDEYASRVKDASKRRQLLKLGWQTAQEARDEAKPLHEQIDDLGRGLTEIAEDASKRKPMPVTELVDATVDRLKKAASERTIPGVMTGFYHVDGLLCGMRPGQLILLAARPGVGKSALALNIAVNAAKRGKQVQFHSFEMSNDEVTSRMIASESGVNLKRIDRALLSSGVWESEVDDMTRIEAAARSLKKLPMWIDDWPTMTTVELQARARTRQIRNGLDLLVVDYLQLMRAPGTVGRVDEVSRISNGLKQIASELQVPVLAVSQLNRAIEHREGGWNPRLSDLRDSGTLEQDAHVVMFLGRKTQTDVDGDDAEVRAATLIVAKQRNGPTGRCPLIYDPDTTTFGEMA